MFFFLYFVQLFALYILVGAYIDSWTAWYMASKKTTSGYKLDGGWQYGIDVDKNSRKVQCKYCQKILNGGIDCSKHHLTYTQKDVESCQRVPEDVKKMILNILVKNQEATEKKRKIFQYIEKDRDNDEGNEISSMNKEKRIVSGSGSTQTTINQLLKKI